MPDPGTHSEPEYPVDRFDNPTTGVRARGWLLLVALAVLASVSIYWAFTAQIPVTVQSQGILLYPTGVSNIEANYSGIAKQVLVARGELVQAGEVLIELNLPDLKMEIEKAETALMSKSKLNEEAASASEKRLSDEKELAAKRQASKTDAIATIQQLIESNLRVSQTSIATQEVEITKATTRSQEFLNQLKSQRVRLQDSVDRKLATQSELTFLDNEILDATNRLSLLEERRNGLELQKLKTDQTLADLKRRVAELKLADSEIATGLFRLQRTISAELVSREAEIQASTEILENLRLQYDSLRFVRAPRSGIVIELPIAVGQTVSGGEVIATIANKPTTEEEQPLHVISFFPLALGKQVNLADAAFITPTTIQRERFGSIEAEVDLVYSLPVSAGEAIHTIGNQEVLRPFFNHGGLLGIQAKLLTKEDGSLAWTGDNTPPTPTAGTTVAVRIVVERRKPISYLLPFLNRSVFGTETELPNGAGG